ncbi:lipopolysaccharide transport periplasmic protein LptA [Pseudorhodoferax sp. Leaf274]|uniref:lipopolysaccharide transport periplasmic protein LptA n=1 Tax=Pseudorhodoferax sp. Leaf274 TaxID=1736318 RepID=UPI00070371B6|nr:lipopolysaccharide transport periplasmic protein LptA [Pseudorhodoferax sp. Leaf274]KQP47637.1 organic solvent tolerance protein OstA [Pseudorhodoferax sp. Leaf274]
MKPTSAHLLVSLALALSSGLALAERADRDKPMNIEADAMRYDDLKQVNVFTGRVVVTKGTIVARGARVDVRKDAQGYQFGTITAAPGQLAYYRQKREAVDEYIEGEGEVIEYDGKADKVTFIRRAVMRRYVGSTMNDEVTGNVIVYDNVTEVFTVDAAKPGSAGSGGRVRAMLTPTPAASAPKPAAPAQPAAPLKPSTRLGGEKN